MLSVGTPWNTILLFPALSCFEEAFLVDLVVTGAFGIDWMDAVTAFVFDAAASAGALAATVGGLGLLFFRLGAAVESMSDVVLARRLPWLVVCLLAEAGLSLGGALGEDDFFAIMDLAAILRPSGRLMLELGKADTERNIPEELLVGATSLETLVDTGRASAAIATVALVSCTSAAPFGTMPFGATS